MAGSATCGRTLAIGSCVGVTTGGAGTTTASTGRGPRADVIVINAALRMMPLNAPTPTKTAARDALTPAMSRVPQPGHRVLPVPSGREHAGQAKMFASTSPMAIDGVWRAPPRRPIRPTFWLPISIVMGGPP
jgi:hypothetical protein